MGENGTAIDGRIRSACPQVSVVIPTRCRAGLLAQCVASIRAQTVTDIEVIVVVDGPDPATSDLLSSVQDDRLRHVAHPESRGVSNARNTGIDLATGRWLAFCDDDDVWAPTKLAAQLAALSEAPGARWAVTGEVRFRDGASTVSYTEAPAADVVASELPYSNVVPAGCSGVIADRELVIELGAFDPRLSMLADRDLWIRLNWAGRAAIARKPLVGYRDHDGAMTRRLRNVEDELDVIREKYQDRFAESERDFPSERFYIWAYRRTFSAGDRRGGFDFLVRSPRFRRVVPAWLWGRAKRRLGMTHHGVPEPLHVQGEAPISSFPWLVDALRTDLMSDQPIRLDP
jgi:glycosyltransferase involved in cell wall biosynthesis